MEVDRRRREFGLFFTVDGKRWIQLKGGMPIISVRDLAIQRREGDLVAATFGRGFYILDDYSPLRAVTPELLEKEAVLFPVRRAFEFVPARPLGLREKGFNGDSFFTAPNPPAGATFTWYLRDELTSSKKARHRAEHELEKAGKDTPYPSWDALRAEDREEDPAIVLTITDEAGAVVRRITGPAGAGFQRASWDLRYPPFSPVNLKPEEPNIFEDPPKGPLASPGTYSVQLARRVRGELLPLGDPQRFEARPPGAATLPAGEQAALLAFQQKTGRLQRAVLGAVKSAEEAQARIDHLEQALTDTPRADARLMAELQSIKLRLRDLQEALAGDATIAKRNEPVPPSIVARVHDVVAGHWNTTGAATATHQRSYQIAAAAFAPVLEKLRALIGGDLARVESAAEAAGAPWTPGRLPEWKPD